MLKINYLKDVTLPQFELVAALKTLNKIYWIFNNRIFIHTSKKCFDYLLYFLIIHGHSLGHREEFKRLKDTVFGIIRLKLVLFLNIT